MYQIEITYDDVIKALSDNHKVVNRCILKKAYDYAEQMHKGQSRKSGEAYIYHPLRVAKLVAQWGFESDVVAAALLHDIVEDCSVDSKDIETMFNLNIADTVSAVTSMNKELYKKLGFNKQEIDNLSDAHFQQSINTNALFIKIADRLDNLYTIDAMPKDKQIGKAQHTREILIPLAKMEEAYLLVDLLEELCFKIEHTQRYQHILLGYTKICQENNSYTNSIIDMFKDAFLNKNKVPFKDLADCQNDIVKFIYNERSVISIFRQLSKKAKNANKDFDRLLNKNYVAQYDLLLIVKNTVQKPTDLFYEFYKQMFYAKNIYIIDSHRTTYDDIDYLLLCDDMDNLYRLFIKTQDEYIRYRVGKVTDLEDSFNLPDVNEIEPRDSYKTKIKVFKKDGTETYIDEGATVLDFAFAIHSEVGIHFDYALIDTSNTRMNAYTILNAGDTVTIVTSEEKKAEIKWFNYLKTSKATHHLVKYFSSLQ